MKKKIIIGFSIFIAGLCSIIYELLISATATYFLGDGVRQFSILIGVYLFSMGIGAYLSKFFKEKSLEFFIKLEILLGFIGGLSVPFLYFAFIYIHPSSLQILCLSLMFVIGLMTGMEVPLLTFVTNKDEFEDNLSNILSVDYLGGLIATLLFPFILLPFIGLFYSSVLFGIVNICLGLFTYYSLYKKRNFKIIFYAYFLLFLLFTLAFYSSNLLKVWEEKIYKNPIITNIQTPHQKIVITKNENDIRLFLNRAIQFSSKDEYRYHEMLVHIPVTIHNEVESVLVLGGGENLVTRELLKHRKINHIDVIDIDSTMFYLSKNNFHLKKINQNAALNPIVNLIVDDAFVFLKNNFKKYDLIISDLPDPSNDALSRLYSKQFFYLVQNGLKDNGIFVTQAGEINLSNMAFNCIKNTINDVFTNVKAYHSYVPSFGHWGFVMASKNSISINNTVKLPDDLIFLDNYQFQNAFVFPNDIKFKSTKINKLDQPVLLNYFLDEWNKNKTEFGSY